jgi:hypothetical protein
LGKKIWIQICSRQKKTGLVGWLTDPDFSLGTDLDQTRGYVNDLVSLNLDYIAKVFAKKGKKK